MGQARVNRNVHMTLFVEIHVFFIHLLYKKGNVKIYIIFKNKFWNPGFIERV